MKSLKLKSEGVSRAAVKSLINFFSVKSASILLIWVWIAFSLGCSADGNGSPTFSTTVDGNWLPVSDTLEGISPEKAGWSSAELQNAHQFAIQSGCQAVIALYDGKVFFSRGNIHKNYGVDSIRETFLSALYGIHFVRGNLDLEATLEDYHIDDITPGLTYAEKQAAVVDLLTSRSGVYHEAAAENQTMIDTRPARGSHAPDTFFYYNNWDVNTLGTIFEQETGEQIFKAFKKEIADVLEMVDFSIDNTFYDYDWVKSMHPAYNFRMSPRDMAKFGALFQKNGNWRGSQIISGDWIDESTMAYSTMPDTGGLGYGYLWKIILEDSDIGQMIGHPGYYHTGANGYALIVIPDLKLVIVQHYDSDQVWEDLDDDAFELTMLILDARIAD
jgi:hypothetical protein